MANKVMLRQAQMFVVGDLVRAHCKKDEYGFAVYDEGWSDGKIAGMQDFPCTEKNVQSVREALVGKVRRANARSDDPVSMRLDALEKKLAEVMEWASARPVQPFGPDWRNYPGRK